MIKTIVSGLVAVSVLATPVAAEARHRDGGYDRGRHHSRISTGEAIAIGIGGLILGSAIASSRNTAPQQDVYDRPYDRDYEYEYRYRRPVCREVITSGYDRYGDYYEKRTVRCN
jgi:hypothetical protein